MGARGYAGLELARLLLNHSQVRLTHCFTTSAFSLCDELFHPQAKAVSCLTEDKLWDNLTDYVFLATPTEVSQVLAPRIMEQGKTVIDLSGAFRLTAEYGLTPFCGPRHPATLLIANPGCYATAIIMALIPLLKHDLIESEGLVIDAKSGTTGAGRKANEAQLFAEVDGECLPYKVGEHQHLPEIQAATKNFSGHTIDPHFVTHLLPVKRGISAAIFATAKTAESAEIARAYDQEYGTYPLLRHGCDATQLTRLRHVVGTPFTHLSYTLKGEKLYVFSTLDNLLKGAASQAVENLNRCLDLKTSFSLLSEG